jgi:hypothetical protein
MPLKAGPGSPPENQLIFESRGRRRSRCEYSGEDHLKDEDFDRHSAQIFARIIRNRRGRTFRGPFAITNGNRVPGVLAIKLVAIDHGVSKIEDRNGFADIHKSVFADF